MMCMGSLAIACMPTYETIGVMAPALLLVARLFQGLSVGGEYGATATYMSEIANARPARGFYSSFQYVTLIGGQLLAVLVVVILSAISQRWRTQGLGLENPVCHRRDHSGHRAGAAAYAKRNHDAGRATEQGSGKASPRCSGHHKAAFFTVVGYTAGRIALVLHLQPPICRSTS